MAAAAPSRLHAGARCPLCPTIESYPWLWPLQIQCCTEMWSERGRSFHLAKAGVCQRQWQETQQLATRRVALSPLSSGASQHMHTLPIIIQVSHSLPVNPSGPPTSQRGSFLLCRTQSMALTLYSPRWVSAHLFSFFL